MPQFGYVPHPDGVSTEEFAKVLELRLATLEDATKLAGMGRVLPLTWRKGWKATVVIVGRDRDGSLCFRIVVEGPAGVLPYTRSYRLTRSKRLSSGLTREWRET